MGLALSVSMVSFIQRPTGVVPFLERYCLRSFICSAVAVFVVDKQTPSIASEAISFTSRLTCLILVNSCFKTLKCVYFSSTIPCSIVLISTRTGERWDEIIALSGDFCIISLKSSSGTGLGESEWGAGLLEGGTEGDLNHIGDEGDSILQSCDGVKCLLGFNKSSGVGLEIGGSGFDLRKQVLRGTFGLFAGVHGGFGISDGGGVKFGSFALFGFGLRFDRMRDMSDGRELIGIGILLNPLIIYLSLAIITV